ncbi:MAG: DUF4957 domain-containing protein [Prevotella sp.]|nr:DUF4957 domain-containing protein [Prevotella sp.]
MKPLKYFVISLLGLLTVGFVSSCDDDLKDGDAPRLFRPVASLETNNNSIIASWDNIAGATSYTLELYKVTGTDDAGNNTYELYRTVTCESSPYTFSDLEWDEKYKVAITCNGPTKSSGKYETNDASIPYPTTLKSVKTIENAARITWDNGKKEEASESSEEEETEETDDSSDDSSDASTVTIIKAIVAVPVNGGERVVKIIDQKTFDAGYTDIMGLDPQTQYYFIAYTTDDESEFNNSTYAGRLSATTGKAIDFDEKYGAGMWVDIRGYDEKQAKDTLKSETFWNEVITQDGMTIILRGDFDYKVNNSIALDKSVRFVTASTLGSNARFISSGGITMAKDAQIDWVEFENVDFISDKALNGDNDVNTNTDPTWGGRQVFNINGTNATLKKLSFKGCTVTGYRAFVRAQKDGDNINEIVVDNCTLNCIGDQGVFTTTNKLGDWKQITLKNSTVTNIVMLCDFRATANPLTFNIENCTFCYAPKETTANANTPLLRLNGNKNTISVNISNTLFGPSMATEKSEGDAIHTYTAGTAGSIFLNGNTGAEDTPLPVPLVSVSKSFKTNFGWWVNDKGVSYPIDALQELGMDEKTLWSAPEKGEFRIMANLPESGLGAPMWQ